MEGAIFTLAGKTPGRGHRIHEYRPALEDAIAFCMTCLAAANRRIESPFITNKKGRTEITVRPFFRQIKKETSVSTEDSLRGQGNIPMSFKSHCSSWVTVAPG